MCEVTLALTMANNEGKSFVVVLSKLEHLSTFLCFLPLNWDDRRIFLHTDNLVSENMLKHIRVWIISVWCVHTHASSWGVKHQWYSTFSYHKTSCLSVVWELMYRKKGKDNQHHDNRLIPCVARQLIQQAWVCLLWQWRPNISCLSCSECFFKSCMLQECCTMFTRTTWCVLSVYVTCDPHVSNIGCIKPHPKPWVMLILLDILLEQTGIKHLKCHHVAVKFILSVSVLVLCWWKLELELSRGWK